MDYVFMHRHYHGLLNTMMVEPTESESLMNLKDLEAWR